MHKPKVPENEKSRLEALHDYQILDTLPEQQFDDITLLASQICDVPISVISFVDESRQWFKSHQGTEISETPREISFCAHTIHHVRPVVIDNLTEHELFKDHPMVCDGPNIQFYAGIPLRTTDGFTLGTLCVMDTVPKKLSPRQIQALESLSRQVMSLLNFRKLSVSAKLKNEQLEGIFDGMMDGVLVQDSEGKVTSFNKAAVKILGQSEDELKGLAVTDSRWKALREDGTEFPANQRPAMMAIKTKTPIRDCIVGFQNPLQGLRWVRVSSVPIRDGVITTFHDITEAKNKDREIRSALERVSRSEETFRAIFENSPHGITQMDSKLRYIAANPAYTKFLGYEESELIFMNILDVSHPDDYDRTKNVLQQLTNPNWSLDMAERRYVTKSGEIVWGRISSRALRFTEDGPIFIFSIVENVTEFKKMEAARKLAEAQLISTAKLSSLGEMAGGIAHEINNPLVIIHGKASMLKTRLDAPNFDKTKCVEDIERIEFTVERIAKIIKGLRSFSRNADQDPIVRISISSIVDDALELCRERFRIQQVALNVHCETSATLDCRPSQIVQVLMNLLGNAFDAVQKLNEKWVEFDVRVQGKSLCITVTDSGAGIKPQVVEKMMQPFFTTKEIGKGTGLGLSISLGIVQDHHGKVIYNPEHPHTQFMLNLPLRSAEGSGTDSKAA